MRANGPQHTSVGCSGGALAANQPGHLSVDVAHTGLPCVLTAVLTFSLWMSYLIAGSHCFLQELCSTSLCYAFFRNYIFQIVFCSDRYQFSMCSMGWFEKTKINQAQARFIISFYAHSV